MHLNRRQVFFGASAGVALAAAGATLRVLRRPDASGPWEQSSGGPEDFRLDIFRAAILAPNPHNRQPWQMRLVGEREAVVTCDLERRLPQTDPFDRQITIGFGAFLELAAIAAAQTGHRAQIELFPHGEPQPRLDERPVAFLRFEPDGEVRPDPLFRWIRLRRSNKQAFDLDRPVSDTAAAIFAAHSAGRLRFAATTELQKVRALRELVIRAFELETNTPRTMKESADLLRVGSVEIERNPDGIPLQGPLFEALSLFDPGGVRAQAMDPQSSAFRSTMARYRSTFSATPAFGWVISRANTRQDQIAAGRAYVRANLDATSRGLSMAPVSQALQEFPEMAQDYKLARELLGAHGEECVQLLVRLGYGPKVAAAPRWPLEAKLLKGQTA
jgi:hypothetical protein